MKTKHIIYLILSFLSMEACQPKTSYPDSLRETIDQLQKDMTEKHLNHNLTQLQLQNLPIQENIPLLSEERSSVVLSDVNESSATLVFRYSEVHCNSCIDLVIQRMNEYYEAGLTNMAIIASYSEYRHFTSFARANQLKMPCFLLEKEEAKGIFNTEIPPYLFVLDQTMRIQYPFVPIKELEEGVDMYLDFIQSKLQDPHISLSRNSN